MIRMIKRWFYKLERLSAYEGYVNGKFKVLYNDGNISSPMDYITAKKYAAIFDGKIVDNF